MIFTQTRYRYAGGCALFTLMFYQKLLKSTSYKDMIVVYNKSKDSYSINKPDESIFYIKISK